MPARARRSRCPVACTLDVLGDRWSLLVVRDVMRGKRRYAEFLDSPEGIPTNILADRLKRLVAKGVIRSRALQPASAARGIRADRQGRGPAADHAGDGGVGHPSCRRPHPASRKSFRAESSCAARVDNFGIYFALQSDIIAVT